MSIDATITCTICGASIPMSYTDDPSSQGLSLSYDTALVDEHVEMHKNCTCGWASDTGARWHVGTCSVHGALV